MRHASLFSGIGGFDLAAEWMGWENVFHCDINPFGKKVLEYYYPNSISYADITKTDFTIHRGDIDILTGGFPCQPYSLAGKRKGKEDERHLWPQMLRAIKEIQPRWIIGENVYGLVNWDGGLVFHEVQSDLEAEGYEVFPYVLPACSINAPHRRDRVFFVAYSISSSERANKFRSIRPENGKIEREGTQTIHDAIRSNGFEGTTTDSDCNGLNECNGTNEINPSQEWFNALGNISESNGNGNATDTKSGRLESKMAIGKLERGQRPKFSYQRNQWDSFPSVSPLCAGDDGISDRLDSITFSKWRKQSIMAGGNAVVPQLIYVLFKTITKFEQLKNNL
jgi:DNA (cytosine-5)-methyltransferase 1